MTHRGLTLGGDSGLLATSKVLQSERPLGVCKASRLMSDLAKK